MSLVGTKRWFRMEGQGVRAARPTQQGSIEGRLLVLLGVGLLVTIGLMAWFSAPPDPADNAVDTLPTAEVATD